MDNIKDYDNLLLKFEVLIFETNTRNSFELDTIHYLYVFGYCCDPMLRLADLWLKLISDIEKYQFIKFMKRGTISVICKNYGEVNDKFLNSHDSSKL